MGEVVKHRNQVPTTSGASAEKPPGPPPWLQAWSPHEPVPVDAETLRGALAKAELALDPAPPEQVLVMLEETLELYGMPDNWDRVAKFYLEALADLPEDLLERALRHVRQTCKWFPKPAEMRKPIAAELTEREATVKRLRLMQDMKRRGAANLIDRRPPTEAEVSSVSELVQRALANMRAARE